MKKILAMTALLALAACGSQPIVKDGDLKNKLTSLGYTKVLIQPGKLNCGQFGRGKHFLGTQKDGDKVIGQICYRKGARDVEYKVDVNKRIVVQDVPDKVTPLKVPNPWTKSN